MFRLTFLERLALIAFIFSGTKEIERKNQNKEIPEEEPNSILNLKWGLRNYTYKQALDAIAVSDMSEYSKDRASDYILKNEDSSYYRAIVAITNDKDRSSFEKLESIRNLTDSWRD